jgi:hypothetical protein
MDNAKSKTGKAMVHYRNVICALCILSFLLSGCQPLRKKFTRKKKGDKEAEGKFIPVLEPIDYPVKAYSLEQDYKQHFSLWKVWERDLMQSIENDDSDKRQKYLLGKSLEELGEMNALMGEAQQAGFGAVLEQVRQIQKEYDKPAAMRSKFSVKKRLNSSSKEIRNHYSPKQIFPDQP